MADDAAPEPFLRPIPYDPSADIVLKMFPAGEEWLLSTGGEYETAAVEVMKSDGKGYEQLIALQWPVRNNKTDNRHTLRMMIDPEDAIGLAEVLLHTARWMAAAKRMGN